jgi:hypothetical protein
MAKVLLIFLIIDCFRFYYWFFPVFSKEISLYALVRIEKFRFLCKKTFSIRARLEIRNFHVILLL